MSFLLLAVFWTLWCALHSFMISQAVVSSLKERLRDRYRYYRILFNLVSVATLIPVLIYSHSLKGIPLFNWSGIWRPVQFALAMSAMALFYSGGRHYDLWQFLGVRQVVEHETRKSLTVKGGLDTSGILGIVRHPWYTAAILIIWARPLDLAALVANTVLTAYLVVGTVLEERKLVAEFGREYEIYQELVPMFLPGLKRGKEKG